MGFNRKESGQGAFEYLMTYGWAIIIIFVIGATLWYLGIFDVEEKVTSSAGFSKIKPLEPTILLTPDGNFSGIFVNGAGYPVNITNITLLNLVGPPRKKCNVSIDSIGNKRAGEAFLVTGNDCVDTLKGRGQAYTLRVNISYTETVSGSQISRIERGNILGFYEIYVEITTTSVTTTTSTSSTSTSSTSTSTSTTSTTSTTVSTTTVLGTCGVNICGNTYDCGPSDGICPSDFDAFADAGYPCTPGDDADC